MFENEQSVRQKTQTIGGAYDKCLQYHDKKTRKNYKKILLPET